MPSARTERDGIDLPTSLDVDTSAADACMQMGLDLIQNPDAIMRESDDWNTPAFTNAWDDIISG